MREITESEVRLVNGGQVITGGYSYWLAETVFGWLSGVDWDSFFGDWEQCAEIYSINDNHPHDYGQGAADAGEILGCMLRS